MCLPDAGSVGLLRWDLNQLYHAPNEQGPHAHLTWADLADELGCMPAAGYLRTARLATGQAGGTDRAVRHR